MSAAKIHTGSNVYLHPLYNAKPLLREWCCEASLCIENYDLIERHFGPDAARQVHSRVLACVQRALGPSDVATPGRGGSIELILWGASFGAGSAVASKSAEWLQAMARDIAMEPVMTGSGAVHASIRVTVQKGSTPVGGGGVGSIARDAGGGGPGAADCEGLTYRADMTAVSPLLRAIGGSRHEERCRNDLEIGICWRKVAPLGKAGAHPFHEASLCFLDTAGQLVTAEAAIEAAERLGFVQVIDHHLVSRLVGELLEAPSSLALSVAVSTASLRANEFWAGILKTLEQRPSVASRMIIEVRGSPTALGWSEAQQVISRLRAAGSRLSIGNFGAGFSSLRDLVAQKPDFITIDRRFLTVVERSPSGKSALTNLVGLAQALGAEVVLDGIDSEEAFSTALPTGAAFHKGILAGLPRLCRPWAIA